MHKKEKDIRNFILKLIREISDEEYQKRVWVEGKGPEVSSFAELISAFDEDLIEDLSQNYQKYGFTRPQFEKIQDLYQQVDDYTMSIPDDVLSEEIVSDPRWHQVRQFAKKFLKNLD